MSDSRRFHLWIPTGLEAELRNHARSRGLGLGPAIRLLVAQAMAAEGGSAPRETAGTLAALTAAEHAVLMVASILPEGERRMRSLAEHATEAAAQRLATFTDAELGR